MYTDGAGCTYIDGPEVYIDVYGHVRGVHVHVYRYARCAYRRPLRSPYGRVYMGYGRVYMQCTNIDASIYTSIYHIDASIWDMDACICNA